MTHRLVLVDANILLYAVDADSPRHTAAADWLEGVLNGDRRVGLPWQSLVAFVRIATHPRASRQPLDASEAWAHVERWLDAPAAWLVEPTRRHREVLGGLLARHGLTGNLVSDAVLAALCVEHGLTIVSADSDFARFDEIRRLDPTAP